MKSINIAGFFILGLALLSNESESVDAPEVCLPVVTPGKEVVADSQESIASNFPRPRKPCPPSGPGRK